MEIESPKFEHNQTIPRRYTCDGENVSPPLSFHNIPPNTKSLALIMEDPDAPSGTWDHWVVWNLPPETQDISENGPLPVGSNVGKNDFKTDSYKGPCPPQGPKHRYFFKLYALDIELNLTKGSSKHQLEEAMEGHILARAETIGTYQR